MKKTILVFLLLCCFFFYFSSAQAPLVKQWDKRFGGMSDEYLYSVSPTKDGGYILGGTSNSGMSGDKTQISQGGFDYWIVKIDSLGNKQWDKTFGSTGDDWLASIYQTNDGGYILGGTSRSGIGGDKTQSSRDTSLNNIYRGDYWIIKIDSLGNKQWDKDFGGTNADVLNSLQETNDRGYILGGYSSSNIGGDKTQVLKGGDDFWIVKIDSFGNKEWDKDLGGISYDELYSLQQTKDGGYILGGVSYSGVGGDKTQINMGAEDYWIIKIDSAGNKKWDKNFGGSDDDYLYSLRQTSDGGYILGGYSYSDISGDKTQSSRDTTLGLTYGGDYWIVKIDSLGNKQWDKDFGGEGMEDSFGNIIQTYDGGYMLSGPSYSNVGGDKTENNSLGTEQTWIIKTNSLGIKQWDKTILSPGHNEVGFVMQTWDGCYAIASWDIFGSIGGYNTQPSQGGADYWIIKFCDTTQAQHCNLKASFSSSDTAFCGEAGECIDFTDLSTCNPISWKWSFPGATPDTSTQQNPKNICYYIPGTYPVTLIVTDSVTSDTLTVSPMIIFSMGPASPVITLTGDDTLCSSFACFYQWYHDGSPIPGATDQCYVVTNLCGVYNVYVTDCYGCSRLSFVLYPYPDPCVGINELSALPLHIYPNPAESQFTVSGLQFTVGAFIEVYDVLGHRVYSDALNSKEETVNLPKDGSAVVDCKQFPPGIYIVEVNTGERIYRTKIIKE